jgi:hypothetical protein
MPSLEPIVYLKHFSLTAKGAEFIVSEIIADW